jgi:hypothetical protein
LLVDLRRFKATRSAFPFGEYIHLVPDDERVKPAEIKSYLQALGHSHISVRPIEPSIEDCFMEMMKKSE